ncbi:MAG: T9SS type A sorting domain-containing protein, partial [Hymenobacter sp.]
AGQLGTGAAAATPRAVGGSVVFARIAAGAQHSLALTGAGRLYAWGDNTAGQLGTGAAATTPTAVAGYTFAQLAAGSQHSLALTSAGALYSWGDNTYGQLGVSNAPTASAPTLVAGAPTLAQLAAGAQHSLALTAAGTLYAWGDNDSGELGLGSVSASANPAFAQEATLSTGWTTLGAGGTGNFSLVRMASAHALASTGTNEAGQLGDGTTTTATRFDRLVPLRAVPMLAQPLPVVLVRFAAQRTGPATAALTWATASETGNLGFRVEKSTDGATFASLGFVAGAGSSAAAHAYAFTDVQALGISYYRLVQLDQNGTVTYSPTQVVGGLAASLALVPNPARGPVQVVGLPAGATLEVCDALGRVVRPATATTTLEVAGLLPGVYLVRAAAPQQAPQTARLVIE